MDTKLIDLSNVVKELCSNKPAYIQILQNILEVDKAYEKNQFGWEFDKVQGWSGAHVKVLMDAKIIRYGYKSNNYTYYRLNMDYTELEQILTEIEQSMKQAEQGHVCQVIFEPSMISEFEELISSGQDMVAYWAQRLNPRIIGMEREREACLISLASPPDKDGLNRRCHTLIYGPPGTAKSILVEYIKRYFDAIEIYPEATSKVGLTVDARGAGTEGAMVMAHNKVLITEEIQDFDRKVLNSMRSAMASGEFDVHKGDHHECKQAAFRNIAVGNDISKLPAALLDRFSFIFHYEILSKEQENLITDKLYDQWICDSEDYKGVKLRAFLEWIKSYEPLITPEILNKCKRLKQAYIELTDKKPNVREKESFLKVAFVIAKINHRALIVNDFLRSVQLVAPDFSQSKFFALETIAKGLDQ